MRTLRRHASIPRCWRWEYRIFRALPSLPQTNFVLHYLLTATNMGRSVHAPLTSAVSSPLAVSADLRRRLFSFIAIRTGSSHELDPAALPVTQFTTPDKAVTEDLFMLSLSGQCGVASVFSSLSHNTSCTHRSGSLHSFACQDPTTNNLSSCTINEKALVAEPRPYKLVE